MAVVAMKKDVPSGETGHGKIQTGNFMAPQQANGNAAPVKSGRPAATRNVTAFHTLVTRLLNRSGDQGGIGVFYGWSGLGKSKSASFAAQSTQAAWVEIGQFTTSRKLMQHILMELRVKPKGSVADMMDDAIMAMAENPSRPLIIDEAHWLVEKRLAEVAKELSDKSGAPVILIGEEMLPQGLAAYERVWRRVLDATPALPADLDDARRLAAYHADGIEIADDLLTRLVEVTAGNAGWIVNNISDAIELARQRGLARLTASDWGAAPIRHGTVPKARQASGLAKRRR